MSQLSPKEQVSFNFMAAVSVCSGFGAQENKVCHCFHFSPSICHEVLGLDAMILVFWMLNFKPSFHSLSPSSKGSSVPLHFLPLEWLSFVYLRWFIFLQEILIPTCDSPSLAFQMMYSAYKLNKQGDNIQPWHTPFPILNQPVVPCLVLTVAFSTAYRFLRRQVKWSGIPISLKVFHSLLWST